MKKYARNRCKEVMPAGNTVGSLKEETRRGLNVIQDDLYQGVIAGGCSNNLGGALGTARCGMAILGGENNVVNNCYSSILGGCNNTVNHDFSAAFGCGVNTVAANTFHAINFAAQNMPTVAGPAGSGILWRQAALGGWVVMIS